MQKHRLLEQALPSLFPFSLPPPPPLFAPATQASLLPLQYVIYRVARGELQGSLSALLLVLLCIVALLADRV